MNFWSQKLARTYYQCLEYVMAVHVNCSFLLTLALKNWDMCHGIIGSGLIKIQPNLIKILVPYRLMIGSWSGLGVSTTFKVESRLGRFSM